MATKFVDNNSIAVFKAEADKKYVAQVAGKGLSTNDLTDELLDKINNAGDSTFTGAYADLTGKPSIGGKEIASGDQTAASLGLETSAGAQAKADAAKTSALSDAKAYVDGKGYQTASQVQAAVDDGKQGMATEDFVTSKGYQTSANVDSKVNAAKTELTASINAAIASVFKPKGSSEFAKLPDLASSRPGDVWNVTDAFSTTADFIDGAGRAYPSGTNIVCVTVDGANKWDVLAGIVDLSGYVRKSDLVPLTEDEIKALFA